MKENGRLKPAEKKEVSSAMTRYVVCKQCDWRQAVDKKVFGEVIICPECGGEMEFPSDN